MRITYCLSHFYPQESGAERQAARQGRELIRRGHEVQIITRAVPGLPTSDEYAGMVIQRAIKPIEFGPLFGLTFLQTLRRALKQYAADADVIHSHQALWEAAATGSLQKQLGGMTVVQPAAGGKFGEIQILAQTKGKRWLKRWILQNSFFVAISDQIEDELRTIGVPDDRLLRIGSGVDTTEFSPGDATAPDSDAITLPGRPPRFLFVGRLAEQKNLMTLMEAWAFACGKWHTAGETTSGTMVLVGEGPNRHALEQLCDQLGVSDSVVFAGAQENVVDYLRAADVFVLPSFAEGMSNSLLEAMATGLPSIVSSIGGNVDLIQDALTGLVVDVTDARSLGDAILALGVDAERRAAMGRAAREHILAQYSIESIVDRYVELYEQLVNR